MRTCFLQDAHCKVPSDWLDAGYGDLSVPTVPTGFMREVVFHFEADTPSSSATRSHPARSVFYHFFKDNDAPAGSVKREALLRAPANPDDADAEKTVQGTLTLTVEDFLRSKLIKKDAVQPSDFIFYDSEADGPGVLPAAIPANALASQSKAAQFPLVGGSLKCCECGRGHNVPEKVMGKVRCPSSERSCCDVIRRWHRHSCALTG